MQSLDDLIKTLLCLCDKDTIVLMSYEERETGNKPLIEKKFFEVRKLLVIIYCTCDLGPRSW